MFQKLQTIPGAKVVAAGGRHSLVLTQEGRVWATGWNRYGQLGDGTAVDRAVFTRVITSGVQAVAAGDIHTIVSKQDGSVWATGGNDNGQLGDGTGTDCSSFVKVISKHIHIHIHIHAHTRQLFRQGDISRCVECDCG